MFEPKKNTKIFSEKIIYLKKDEIIFTKTRSKITDEIKTIDSDEFEYKKNLDILKAKGNVEIIDREKNYRINAEEITYLKKTEEILFMLTPKGTAHLRYIINFELIKI